VSVLICSFSEPAVYRKHIRIYIIGKMRVKKGRDTRRQVTIRIRFSALPNRSSKKVISLTWRSELISESIAASRKEHLKS